MTLLRQEQLRDQAPKKEGHGDHPRCSPMLILLKRSGSGRIFLLEKPGKWDLRTTI